LDITFGGGNTSLHLATFLGAREVVKELLENGADRTVKNGKGFAPLDIVDGTCLERVNRSR
jgi:ankyrin repeat protein